MFIVDVELGFKLDPIFYCAVSIYKLVDVIYICSREFSEVERFVINFKVKVVPNTLV